MINNRLLLVYNPIAGKGHFVPHLSNVIDLFTKAGFAVEVYPTQSRGDAARKIMSLGDEYCMVVPAGGDGTLDEIVTGMFRAGKMRPIGYIPVGSTNDYAVSLGISTNIMEAAGSIVAGKPVPLDVGVFNREHIFIYVAAFGAFTNVAYETNQDLKNIFGHGAYLIEAAKQFGFLKSYPIKVTIGEESIEQNYVFGMVSNSISVGGFKNITGKDIKLDDGKFEVTLVRNPKNLLDLQEIGTALLTGNRNTSLIDYYVTDRIRLESTEEIAWTFDGEFGGSYKDVEIEDRCRMMEIVLEDDRK